MSAAQRPEFRISRVFDAPRSLVFEAWSKAEYVARWFTPAPLTTPVCEVDLRAGGVFRVVMRMPNGSDHPMNATFVEVVPDEKIVFKAIIDGDLEVHTTVTFTDEGEKTRLDAHQVYARQSPSTLGAPAGWAATLDQLAAHLRDRG